MTDAPQTLSHARHKARSARRLYPVLAAAEIGSARVRHVPVVIVGAGPVGLAMAAELANHRVPVVLLEKGRTSSDGSRAICWSKRSLEICDRFGVAARMMSKGVTWNVGKVYTGSAPDPLYTFDLLPIKAQKFPAFINLQQYHAEEYLVDALAGHPLVELRWGHEVVAVTRSSAGVTLGVRTGEGDFTLEADYVIAADGCRSTLRGLLGLDFEGRTFEDNFLIVDVRMDAPFPAERRFYFDAPFNAGRTALMHQQPDGIWRLDFQLGWDIDRDAALSETNVSAKVRAMLGPDLPFEYEWISLYTFQCRRMRRFVHDRVIFVGDAAHLVSPFGARGANSGLQDVDNLGWKLARVLRGEAPRALLDSYDAERVYGADENLRNSTRATDFMTPKTPAARAFQQAVLQLAEKWPFARALVNSGRLSVPSTLRRSALVTADEAPFETPGMSPGSVVLDAPVRCGGRDGWLSELLGGDFVCLVFGSAPPALPGIRTLTVGTEITDPDGLLAARYDALPGTTYLVRPDQHVAARWRRFDTDAILRAWRRSLAHETPAG